MSKPNHEVAVVYTDGSHLSSPDGTGAGIHVYCYDDDFRKKLADHKGVVINSITEIITRDQYDKMPAKAIVDELPKAEFSEIATYECAYPLYPSTSQVGELMAFLAVFERAAPFTAKQYHIHTDSMYLINGITAWMENWERKGWVRGCGGVVGNKEIWKKILKTWRRLKDDGIKVNLYKIKGHSDRYGNDAADRLAGLGSATSLNMHAAGEAVFLPKWDKISELDDAEAEDAQPNKSKKSSKGKAKSTKSSLEARLLPNIAAQKLFYVVTNEPSPIVEIDGKKWHYILSGDHAKNKDDLALVGKYLPDTMFTITFTEEPFQVVFDVANEHAKIAWGDTPLMHRYDAVAIVSGLHINRKKFASEYRQGLDLKTLELRENKNVMMFDDKTYICQLARPPLLSYRSIEIRDELAAHLQNIVEEKPEYTLTDITDELFDDKDKPTKIYRNVDRAITFNVKHACSDKEVPVILSRGIDIPNRTDLNRIKEPDGRFYVVTWLQDTTLFRYAVVYKSPTEYGFWMGYYSASRLLTEKEL